MYLTVQYPRTTTLVRPPLKFTVPLYLMYLIYLIYLLYRYLPTVPF
jgi:hypothetical protein